MLVKIKLVETIFKRALEEDGFGGLVLHKTMKRMEFKKHIIISSKVGDTQKVLGDFRDKEKIF